MGYYWLHREGISSDRMTAHRTAVILFSGFDVDGNIDDETLRRIHHAVEYVNQKDSGLILCCGGARPQSGSYGSLFMRDYLLRLGYDPASVVAETISNSTHSNIRGAIAILRERNVREATLVSSPIHLPRVKHVASREKGSIEFDYSAYPLDHGRPPASLATIYCQIHHEWAAWLADMLLPDGLYTHLLNRLRS
ncbi:MAG: YdcF family protein [Syntrophaceae bacterium]|nr:YdcF family protein [Syntrophaceae bacterium]